MDVVAETPAPSGTTPPLTSPTVQALGAIEDEIGRLALWNDPDALYGHCLCGEEWP